MKQAPPSPSNLWNHALAVGMAAVAIGLDVLFRPVIAPHFFVLPLAAVCISAWRGGLWPGLLATVLSLGGAASLFVFSDPTTTSLSIAFRLLLYDSVSLLICAVNEKMRSALQEARDNERSLRAAQEQLRTVVSNLPVVLNVLDRDGRVVLSQGAALTEAGLAPEQMIGRTVFDLFSDCDWYLGDIRRALGDHSFVGGGEHKGRHYEVHYRPYHGEDGEVAGVIALSLDITARKLLEQEHVRLLQTTQEARRVAEDAQDRMAFLAKASTLLDASLDYPTTLASMACLAVPRIGDWCAIDLVDTVIESGRVLVSHDNPPLSRISVVHGDPAKAVPARQLLRRRSPTQGADAWVRQALSSGRALVICGSEMEMRVLDREHLSLLRELGCASLLCVPFLARGRTLGAITFVRADPQRRYDEADQALAEDLALRAAIAIDTAQLYHQAQSQAQLHAANRNGRR